MEVKEKILSFVLHSMDRPPLATLCHPLPPFATLCHPLRERFFNTKIKFFSYIKVS